MIIEIVKVERLFGWKTAQQTRVVLLDHLQQRFLVSYQQDCHVAASRVIVLYNLHNSIQHVFSIQLIVKRVRFIYDKNVATCLLQDRFCIRLRLTNVIPDKVAGGLHQHFSFGHETHFCQESSVDKCTSGLTCTGVTKKHAVQQHWQLW